MRVVSLFSGIGGIELGLQKHGFETVLFCEIDDVAGALLEQRFPGVALEKDITQLSEFPEAELITAGFPCQDLSQAGGKNGIKGRKSGLVASLFGLLQKKPLGRRPEYILIENVPYMLRLGRGSAMGFLTGELERLGYSWAYRVVDARSFGLPQRRPRVLLLASLGRAPGSVLFANNYEAPDLDGKPSTPAQSTHYGFYWTEGSRGVGWTCQGVPPIKCGSTIGIASPPAVWLPDRDFVGMIDIRDAERLQGFPTGWTDFEELSIDKRPSFRWRLVGNAVSTKMSEWVGRRLRTTGDSKFDFEPLDRSRAWPNAAFGNNGHASRAHVTPWASKASQLPLSDFLRFPLKPLSLRATRGFLKRAGECTNVVYSPRFIESLQTHAERMGSQD